MNYSKHYNLRVTPQTEQAKPNQVQNSAGGYTFQLDCWGRLNRWLILGCEGGTYYASEKKLTVENAKTVKACLKEDGRKTVDTIVEVSDSGRAPKNDPAIFALALAASDENPETRKYALSRLNDVCRIPTHLFQFVEMVKTQRGFGRGLRTAISNWYTSKTPDNLAYSVLKYQNRNGWSHKDLLRQCHATPSDGQESVFRWIVSGADFMGAREVKGKDLRRGRSYPGVTALPSILSAYEEMKVATDVKAVVKLITDYNMSHEMVPNQWKNEPAVWEALVQKMPYTATLRNLSKLGNLELLKPLSSTSKLVRERLENVDQLKKARVHPLNVLSAMLVYGKGHGLKGSLTWTPNQQVVDSLDNAFYKAFDTVEPTGKRLMLALDVSGSMTYGTLAGVPLVTPAVAAACLAMVTAKTEQEYLVFGFGSHFEELKISGKKRLEDVVKYIYNRNFGSTDCSLPMIYAMQQKLQVDGFAVFTDSETYAGRIHPHQALKQYRDYSGLAGKQVVVGMTATNFTIADPDDPGAMDMCGFDSSGPAVMADFFRG